MSTPATAIVGADVVTPDDVLADTVVVVEGGVVAAVGAGRVPAGAVERAAHGLLLVPGIVDLHGDGFERCLQPRPIGNLPLAGAVAEAERAMVAAGITTSCWSVTDSFEPGLRSRQTLRELVASVPWRHPERPVDHRLHLRHEWLATDEPGELLDLLRSGAVDLLSINDHAPAPDDEVEVRRLAAAIRGRAGLALEEAVALLSGVERRRREGDRQVAELVAAARDAGVPVASHDDDTPEALARSLGWGVAVVEFPATLELAAAARTAGAAVLMGAPNVLRGGSHVGFPSVADAAAAGVVDILCSDYHAPSLLTAPFLLAASGLVGLPTAWAMVSAAPSAAMGWDDRGRIEVGARADLLLVRPPVRSVADLVAVWRGGREVARFG